MEEKRNTYRVLGENLKKRDHYEVLDTSDRINIIYKILNESYRNRKGL